ncbi:MAG: BamA/TamA family outer membrane protein, partial [Bacteroidota bacterium]|nr:BamA/TamA family outer membrane protein [Bacteroidota bacterium]
RLQAKDGKQYVLRSVDKDPQQAIPSVLRETLAAYVVQDQISASHPYAALAVPYLSKAAGVLTTYPEMVFVPDDPRLGKYQSLFANTLCILEERMEEEQNENLEPQTKVYSTTKMLEKLYSDPDNQVNQREVLRARLFDMLIGDWDRHDDQWRWIGKKEKNGITFTPLPRDRDQVFFVNQGIIPSIASRKWIMPKFQGFDHQLRDVPGFNFNARYFDRSFLNELSLNDWLAMADTLQTRLTDQVIEQAIEKWPTAIQDLTGKEVIAKLKSRRDHLKQDAQTYYQFLAKEVDVPGTEKDEYFHFVRLNPAQSQLKVYKLNKQHEVKDLIYQRLFYHSETKEVRLYGLGGDDRIELEGNVPKSLKVRVIGGPGKDIITDNSQVQGISRKTLVYDSKEGNVLNLNSESKNRTSLRRSDNEYDRKSFQYDYLGPLASIQFNPDDGLYLGAGVLYRKHGFRKNPFATRQRLTGNYAFATSGYNIDYKGEFTDAIQGLDLEVNMAAKGPHFVNNFFGYGNESDYNEEEHDISFYRARVRSIKLNTLLIKNVFSNQKLYIGPAYETYQVENTPGRFISNSEQNGLEDNNLFKRKNYAGLKLGFLFDNRDSEVLPTTGSYWHLESGIFKGLNGNSGDYAKIESDLSLFWSFRLPARITLATRFGGGVNFGDFEFFQANTLGGLTNLRGFRRTRFTGKSSLYNNTEVRLRLFSFRTYIFPAHFGIMGFHDVGRVWVEGENSSIWHNSTGGGIWLTPFNQAVISFMYGISKEEKIPLVRVGFLF